MQDTFTKCSNFGDLNVKWEDVEPVLKSMITEVTDRLDKYKKSLDEESLSKISKQKLDYKNIAAKSIEASPTIVKRPNIMPPTDANKIGSSKFEDDQIFNDLRPVKFDGLYKKEMTSEEIEQEIRKLTQDEVVTPIKKSNARSRMTNVNDSAYPFKQAFKQDKMCMIF
jgi:hypothetical protein